MKSGVYLIQVRGRGYVGSTVNITRRWKEHRRDFRRGVHANKWLQHLWDKYGSEAFAWSTLELVGAPDLLVREQFWVDTLHPAYNLRTIVGSNLGYKHTAAARANMAAANTGRRHSEETKALLSVIARQRPFPMASVEAARLANTGRVPSAETRQRIGDANRGRKRVFSPEHCAALAAANKRRAEQGFVGPNKGRTFGPEMRAKVSAAAKKRVPYVRTPEIRARQASAAEARRKVKEQPPE